MRFVVIGYMDHLRHCRHSGLVNTEEQNMSTPKPQIETDQADRVISVAHLARQLGITTLTVQRIIVRGHLRAHRIGHQWRVFARDLEEYLGRQANRPA
jgi:excisionase family DNA binding protein